MSGALDRPQGLYALAPAAQPMGRQDMLAQLLRGNPDPSLPSYPVMQSAEDRGFAPMPRSFADAGARMAAVLRGQVEPTQGERFAMEAPLNFVGSAGGGARDGVSGTIKQNLKVPDVEIAALRNAMQEKYPDIKMHFGQSRSGHLTVSELVVPSDQRGKGIGTKIMRDLINEADARGLPMALSPDGSFGGNVARLRDFYRRLGFTPNTGRGRDLSVSETMIRPSQPAARSTATAGTSE